MKEGKSGLRNESSKTKRIGLFQRITAAFLLPLIIIYKKVSSTFLVLVNLSLFWHINEGIEEIMADYVHQDDDLRALRHVKMVVARGTIMENPKVKINKRVETELDKFL